MENDSIKKRFHCLDIKFKKYTMNNKAVNTMLRLLVVTIISLLAWNASIFLGIVTYDQSNDDAALNLIAAGAFGRPCPYLIYSNWLFGKFITILYSIFPEVNCYLWTYLILNLGVAILLSIVLSDGFGLLGTASVSIVVNILLSYDFFQKLQYTKNAALYGCIGAVVLLWVLGRKTNTKIYPLGIIISYLYLIIGFCVREKAFLLTVPFYMVASVIYLFSIIIRSNEISRKKFFSRILLLVIPAFLCIGAKAVNNVAYSQNPKWATYFRINEILTEMRDYNQYNYYDSPEEYENAGITELDYQMICNWMWNDPDEFDLEKLEKLEAIGQKYKDNGIEYREELVWKTANEIANLTLFHGLPILFLILFIGAMLADQKAKIFAIFSAMIVFLEIYFLVCGDRYPWRAEICVWVAAIMYLVTYLKMSITAERIQVLIEPIKKRFIEKMLIVLQLVVIVVVFYYWQYYQFDTVKEKEITMEDTEGYYLFNQISSNKDDIFLVHALSAGVLLGSKDIFDIDTKYNNYYSNAIFLGAWFVPAPFADDQMSNIGISNPIKQAIEDNVYVVANEERMNILIAYIYEKYGYIVDKELLDVNGIASWKIILQE